MFAERAELPVYSYREELCDTIAANRVTVVRGATGCGKTTQIPQFVLDQYINSSVGAQCGIIVTQVPPALPLPYISYVIREFSLTGYLCGFLCFCYTRHSQ